MRILVEAADREDRYAEFCTLKYVFLVALRTCRDDATRLVVRVIDVGLLVRAEVDFVASGVYLHAGDGLLAVDEYLARLDELVCLTT